MDSSSVWDTLASWLIVILTSWNLCCSSISLLILIIGGYIAYKQLSAANNNALAQAYSSVWAYLQTPEARESRAALFKIPQEYKNDFSKWTHKEKDMAEIACSTYDVIAILVNKEILERTVIAKPWQYSIIKTWESAQPMIREYRKNRGPNYWKEFEELYNYAKRLPT